MQQMREAFPWDQAPRYLRRDRDAIYGTDFAAMTHDMGMKEVLTAPRSPWQNPFAERLVRGSRWSPLTATSLRQVSYYERHEPLSA
jgi:putative transposase